MFLPIQIRTLCSFCTNCKSWYNSTCPHVERLVINLVPRRKGLNPNPPLVFNIGAPKRLLRILSYGCEHCSTLYYILILIIIYQYCILRCSSYTLSTKIDSFCIFQNRIDFCLKIRKYLSLVKMQSSNFSEFSAYLKFRHTVQVSIVRGTCTPHVHVRPGHFFLLYKKIRTLNAVAKLSVELSNSVLDSTRTLSTSRT
jgi:hypothetical protein